MCECVCVWKRETENMLVCVWQKICMCAFRKIIGSLVNFDGNANEYRLYYNMEVHQKSIHKGWQISSEIQYLSNMCKALHLRPRIMPKWKRCKHHLKLEIPNNLKILLMIICLEELRTVYLKYCNAIIKLYMESLCMFINKCIDEQDMT